MRNNLIRCIGLVLSLAFTGAIALAETEKKPGSPGDSTSRDASTDAPSSKEDSKSDDFTVQIHTLGKIVQVGPDGKVEIRSFDSADGNGLPKEIKLNLGKWLNEFTETTHEDSGADDGGEETAKPRRRMSLRKIFRMNEDGGLAELDSLNPEEITNMVQEAMKGLTDAEQRIKVFMADGDGMLEVDGLDLDLGEFKLDFGPEVDKQARAEMERAMKTLRERAAQFRSRESEVKSRLKAFAQRDESSVTNKLDEILKRLSDLESEVQAIKEAAK